MELRKNVIFNMEISLLNQIEKLINSKDPTLTALKFNEYMKNKDIEWAAKIKNDLFTEWFILRRPGRN